MISRDILNYPSNVGNNMFANPLSLLLKKALITDSVGNLVDPLKMTTGLHGIQKFSSIDVQCNVLTKQSTQTKSYHESKC